MSNQRLIWSPSGLRAYRGLNKDRSGLPLLLLRKGEIKFVDCDLTSYLNAGESISSASVETSGVTASIALSTPIAVLTVQSPTAWGDVTVSLNLSTGEVVKQKILVQDSEVLNHPSQRAYC